MMLIKKTPSECKNMIAWLQLLLRKRGTHDGQIVFLPCNLWKLPRAHETSVTFRVASTRCSTPHLFLFLQLSVLVLFSLRIPPFAGGLPTNTTPLFRGQH